MSDPKGHTQESTMASLTGTIVGSNFDDLQPSVDSSAFRSSVDHKEKALGSLQENLSKCPPIIPLPVEGRTLVVCFDGTGDQFDNDNSNVVKFLSLLKKDDNTKQLVYYQSGIGTYTSPDVATPIEASFLKTLDTAFAWNLKAHIMSGYEFLMQSYITGDRICIFGFSRGAYTARCLAGMLHKVGLLPTGNFQQVPFAYRMYTQADPVGWEQSNEFKKAYCINVRIDFLGVWDTVDSVGMISKRLPFTTSNTIVRTFRHALALDERRAKFKANQWNRPTQKEIDEMHGVSGPPRSSKAASGAPMAPFNLESMDEEIKLDIRKLTKEDDEYRELDILETRNAEKEETPTDIKEVWFAGCHCDIGGGSVSNKTRFSLARIPLRWMIRECFKANTGILFYSDALFDIGMDPHTVYPKVLDRPPPLRVGPSNRIEKPPPEPIPIRLHASRIKLHMLKEKILTKLGLPPKVVHPPQEIPCYLGSEEEEELQDILSPKYDQLKINKAWWIVEYLPLLLRYQRRNDKWVTHLKQNKGKPRIISEWKDREFLVHRTVQMRTEAQFDDEAARRKGKRYAPKAKFPVAPKYTA